MSAKPEPLVVRPSIILASGSPRRKELVGRLGWSFTILAPDVDEDATGTPFDMVDRLSERKARAAAGQLRSGIVLAADTLVAIDGRALGKPVDASDARAMLRTLSGRTHEVLTGVCMMDAASGHIIKRVDRSLVTFHPLTDDQIAEYIATGEPMDKAGAYGIQGAARSFVREINGSFENVMGLPIHLLPDLYAQLT